MSYNKDILHFHIYNRGVDKRKIFMNASDYYRFIHDLYEFNDTRPANPNNRLIVGSRTSNNNKRDVLIDILAFCLMPNHYHLIISTKEKANLTKFMRKLGTGYTLYFNEKHKRSGYLFQGRYKSILINSNEYLLQLSRYIHLNPKKDCITNNLSEYKYSSYPDYIGIKNLPSLTNRKLISQQFASGKEYQNFVESSKEIILNTKITID